MSDETEAARPDYKSTIEAEREEAAQKAADQKTKQYTEGTAKRLEVYEQIKKRPRVSFILTALISSVAGMAVGGKMCSKNPTASQIERICGLPEPCPEPKSVSAAAVPKPSAATSAEVSKNEEKQPAEVGRLLKKYRKAKEKGRYYFAFEKLFELLELDPKAVSLRREIDSFVAEGNLEALKLLRRKLKLLSGVNPDFEEMRAYASKQIRQMREAE